MVCKSYTQNNESRRHHDIVLLHVELKVLLYVIPISLFCFLKVLNKYSLRVK